MTISLLLRKLRLENREFITSEELRKHCREMRVRYDAAVRYFIKKGYIVRIFRGIFYVKPLEELKLGRAKYSHLELVAKGMDLKKVEDWYFGLHTALKLNNMTHEHFTIEEVVNSTIFRPRPFKIAGYSFRFVKLSPSLLRFGIEEKDGMRHSDAEKTILDFIYIWRYNGVPEERIIADVSDWAFGVSRAKLANYAGRYPATVSAIARKLVS
jgi:predicted transcriptional regulator of viral defense system